MPWIELLTLADHTRVESFVPALDEADEFVRQHVYRVCPTDGTVLEFPSLVTVLAHLRDLAGPEALVGVASVSGSRERDADAQLD